MPAMRKFLQGPHRFSPCCATTQAAQNGSRQAEQVVSLGESSWWKQNFALTFPRSRIGLRENVGPSGAAGRAGTGSG